MHTPTADAVNTAFPAPDTGGSAVTAQRVAVIGNGPVGQSAALLLARWGVPVVLLDGRACRDLVGSKSICQQRDILDVWDSVGAGRRIADEGITWTTARTFLRDRELFSYTMSDSGESRFPAFVNLSQSRTEQILDDCIAAQPLIDVRWSHRVTGIDDRADHTVLTCRTPTGPVTITASFVLACAGAGGRVVRDLLGVTFAGHSFADRFLICDIRADLPGRRAERRFYFDPAWNPGRQVLIHPCPGGTFRIDWQVPEDFDLDLADSSGDLDQRIRAIIGDADYRILWKSVYQFQSRLVDRMRVGRVLLAGDCAHLVAPFGARGLNSGVADAENAAWKIAYVLRQWADESIVESYHRERHAAAAENLAVTTATMNFLVPQSAAQREHRRSVLHRAETDAAARAQVDSGRLAEPFWYHDSPLTTPNADRPSTGRPPRGHAPPPGPGVLLPDVGYRPEPGSSPIPIRRLARTGLLLLAIGPVAADACCAAALREVRAPVKVLRADRDTGNDGLLDALAARPGEVWVIRPDAYVAAVLTEPDPAAAVEALRRASGLTEP